ELRVLRRRRVEQAVVRDVDDVAAGVADARGDLGEDAGAIGNFHAQPHQPPVAQQVAQQHVGEDAGVDVAAGDGDADAPSREAGGARAFGDDLAALREQGDRFLDGAFGHDEHVGDVGVNDLQRQRADVTYGDALGDGGAADLHRTVREALRERGVGGDLDADD